VLRVHHLAGKALPPREFRCVALVVTVVAAGAEEPSAAHGDLFAGVEAFNLDQPARILGGPGRFDHLVAEADRLPYAVLGDRLLEVSHDCVSAGNCLLVLPCLELVAERVQVGVGANPRVPKQIPRSTDLVAGLQDHERLARLPCLQVVGGANARDAGANDQHVDVFDAGRVHAVPVRVGAPRTSLSEACAYPLCGSTAPLVLTAEDNFLTVQDSGLHGIR
jgi:hypothetical protein